MSAEIPGLEDATDEQRRWAAREAKKLAAIAPRDGREEAIRQFVLATKLCAIAAYEAALRDAGDVIVPIEWVAEEHRGKVGR